MKLETYKEIYGLWDRGFKQQEIAEVLKLNRHTVSKAIAELKTNYPDLFPVVDKPKILQYDPMMDDKVIEKF